MYDFYIAMQRLEIRLEWNEELRGLDGSTRFKRRDDEPQYNHIVGAGSLN
jgi:hypothetical protein